MIKWVRKKWWHPWILFSLQTPGSSFSVLFQKLGGLLHTRRQQGCCMLHFIICEFPRGRKCVRKCLFFCCQLLSVPRAECHGRGWGALIRLLLVLHPPSCFSRLALTNTWTSSWDDWVRIIPARSSIMAIKILSFIQWESSSSIPQCRRDMREMN